nr:MAG TPA: hypothetical protein [Bacteriophage sp.]
MLMSIRVHFPIYFCFSRSNRALYIFLNSSCVILFFLLFPQTYFHIFLNKKESIA